MRLRQLATALLDVLRRNWFLLGILCAVVLAIGVSGGGQILNPASITTNALVVVLFLISGFTLPSERIIAGIRDIRLHLLIQGFVFILIPLYFFLVTRLWGRFDEQLVVGMYALACLPTTVSSCIVLTQLAGGNVVGTMFNASLANIIGVFVSPLLLSLLLNEAGQGLPPEAMLGVLRNLALKMLLPMAVGQVLRLPCKKLATQQRAKLSLIGNACILAIIYFALSSAAGDPVFGQSLRRMPLPFAFLAASHLLFLLLAYLGSRLLGLDRENMISVLYAAPQKTLAMGVPLLSTYFAQDPSILAVAMLPLLFYHPWQLLVGGVLRSLIGGPAADGPAADGPAIDDATKRRKQEAKG